MFKCLNNSKGFTLIELLLVTVILGILATAGFISYNSYQRSIGIESAAGQVVETLRETQNKAMSVEDSSQWGVHFETNKVVLFYGSSYDPNEVKNQTIRLSLGIQITDITLNPSGDDVIFNKLEGTTNNYGSLKVRSTIQSSVYKTVTISGVGKIDKE